LEELIAKHTGQPLDKVAKDTDRDFILTAEDAVEYGVVEVITSRKIIPELAAAAAGAPRLRKNIRPPAPVTTVTASGDMMPARRRRSVERPGAGNAA